jgi:hypothetical protein
MVLGFADGRRFHLLTYLTHNPDAVKIGPGQPPNSDYFGIFIRLEDR